MGCDETVLDWRRLRQQSRRGRGGPGSGGVRRELPEIGRLENQVRSGQFLPLESKYKAGNVSDFRGRGTTSLSLLPEAIAAGLPPAAPDMHSFERPGRPQHDAALGCPDPAVHRAFINDVARGSRIRCGLDQGANYLAFIKLASIRIWASSMRAILRSAFDT